MGMTVRTARIGRAVALLDLAIVLAIVFHLAGGPVIGSVEPDVRATPDPIRVLGTQIDDTGCARAPQDVGHGFLVYCRDWSAITSEDGEALVVSVYGPDHPVVRAFRGVLPHGLAWGQSITDVMDELGRPYRITDAFGTPTLIYMFADERYGSLELRFNAADRLDAINACLTR